METKKSSICITLCVDDDGGDFDDNLDIPVDIGTDRNDVVDSASAEQGESAPLVPYTTIYEVRPFQTFTDYSQCDFFIGGTNIEVRFMAYERHLATHVLSPNLYTIRISHAHYEWFIKRRYTQIQRLHQQLLLYRATLKMPFSSNKKHLKRYQETVKLNDPVSDNNNEIGSSVKSSLTAKGLPRFPKNPEFLVPYDHIDERMQQLQDYLNNLLAIRIYRNHRSTREFLEVSHLSFVDGLGTKGKEGLMKKMTGVSVPRDSVCCSRPFYSRWLDRWFFIKDTYLGYMCPRTGHVRAVILFDQCFEVVSGLFSMGLKTGLHISNQTRHVALKCWTRRKSREWMDVLRLAAATSPGKEFVQPNQYHSFAPSRCNCPARWFVDGSSYFSAVADALEAAQQEIFICSWWLSPEIYLKRPALCGHHWRLDKILERKAKSGIKVFILLYKEVEVALGINSYYSKQKLVELCPSNIHILRHPDHAKSGIFMWAHHEKIVCIDQTIAFVGGLDLCYGRWDTFRHQLTDLGSIRGDAPLNFATKPLRTSSAPASTRNRTAVSGSHSNVAVDTLSVPVVRAKANTPETERRNVMESLRSKGRDLVNRIYSVNGGGGSGDDQSPDIKTHLRYSLASDDELLHEALDGRSKLWMGKDYVNFIVQDFSNLDAPFDDLIERTTTPRMPWHDVGVCVQDAAGRDVARHFIQRWNATKREKARHSDSHPYLLPKAYTNFPTRPNNTQQQQHPLVTCQVLRSGSAWSCGFMEHDLVEQSIHEAYVDVISKAQHYIYMENQFFISLPNTSIHTKNQIAEVLFKRILKAYKANEVFRVYVVMPLLPGFEGDVGGPSGTALRAIIHWNYASISQGSESILERLAAAGVQHPAQFISFYGLRNYSQLNRKPITELVYVHSKLLIVDDKIVICGSANINDRSLIGKRDSEIAVLLTDEAFDDGFMNGEKFPCGKFAGSLRKHLFREHLGILERHQRQSNSQDYIDVTDPVCDVFYNEIWRRTATLNTDLYEKLFHCIPTDSVFSYMDLRRFIEDKPLWEGSRLECFEMLKQIQGNLVLLPLYFLQNEDLLPGPVSVEGMMPTSLWT